VEASVDLPRVIHAMVQTPDAETFYHRAGAGEALLLLVAGGADCAAGGALLARLSRVARVYAPDAMPEADGRVRCGAQIVAGASWLGSLIDALGIERPTIVADADFAAIALAFACSDPERVARVLPAHEVADRPDGAKY
jgi:pimeloyl-ACP methyl ester carboxylesterase